MASKRERVTFPGVIRGNGYEADCVIEAIKVTEPTTGRFQFIEYHPREVSVQLPPGDYEIEANGVSNAVRYANGYWLARGI